VARAGLPRPQQAAVRIQPRLPAGLGASAERLVRRATRLISRCTGWLGRISRSA